MDLIILIITKTMTNQLDKKTLDKIKKQLLEKREETEKQSSIISQQQGDQEYQAKFPNYGRAEEENAEEVASYDNALAMQRNLKNILDRINLALEKIRKGTYGICDHCGKKIVKKRL
ncbi:MAG: hypothetical protein KAS12_04810, partial [Candidatus Aenigmarchaeota archaeon]|nr:hypothetical protein [Candidatus Aenigmarchaeota archaeon]